MADENVLVAAAPPEETPAPQLSDLDKKRKLGDLESEAPEPLTGDDSQKNQDGESETPNADAEVKVEDESELKRPRLEDNGEQPALAPENGHKEGENAGAVASNIDSLEDGEGLEQIPETLPFEEPPAEQLQNDDSELASAENEKPKAESGGDEKEECKAEAEEPSVMGDDTTNTSKKMDVPNNKVGVLIGKAGDTIRFLQYNSGAKIQITRDADADPRAPTRPVELIGTLESILKAERLINDVIAEADAGGSPSLVARGFSTVQAVVGDQVEIQVPNEKVGLIIGKGGETIKSLQTKSGARIQLVPQHLPAGDQSKERTVRVTGDRRQIEMARELIKEVMTQGEHSSGEDDSVNCYPAFATTDVFPTKDIVYKYLQNTAKNVGFKLVQGSVKQNQNSPARVYCICYRGRKDAAVGSISTDVERRMNTSTKSCGCPFKIVMQENAPHGGWIVKPCLDPRRGTHNHALNVGSRLSSGLSVEAKQFIRKMNDFGVAPCHINAALDERFPDEKQNIRHVYNEIAAHTREGRGDRNSAENCLHLASSNQYVTFCKTREGGVLTHLFLAHPRSVETFRAYPWVVGIDSTYKTNRYGMPLIEMVGMSPCNLNFLIAYAIVIEGTADSYQWVLSMLRSLIISDNYPYVIVTNRELGLIRSIRDVFPESKHLLCTWHINRDVKARVIALTKNKQYGASFLNGV